MNIFWKTDQSDSKSTLIYLKWFETDPKACKMVPKWRQMTPRPPRAARLFVRLAPSGPSWTLKICRENVYFLFMGPSGSDTRRYNMHCKCHSTSICHSWGTFFTFRPLSSIIFMKSASKAMSSWPHGCIKSLKSMRKMDIFWKRTKVTPNQHSYT